MTNPIITRQKHMDCAHGLMILYMMVYHLFDFTIIDTPLYEILTRPLSFFMSWFYFKSGVLCKDHTVHEVIFNGLKKFVIPAIIFSIIGFVCLWIIKRPEIHFSNEFAFFYLFGCFKDNTPVWFLFSLFAVQILFSLLKKIKTNNLLIVIISIGLFFMNKYIGFRPYWSLYIPIGLFFYSLGVILKDLQYNNKIVITCIIVYFILIWFPATNIFSLGRFTPFIVVIPFSLAGCILTNVVFKHFKILCIVPLRFFGQHAMEFLCTHLIFIKFIDIMVKDFAINHDIIFEYLAFIIYLISLSAILYFFKLEKIQWMFGRKKLNNNQ